LRHKVVTSEALDNVCEQLVQCRTRNDIVATWCESIITVFITFSAICCSASLLYMHCSRLYRFLIFMALFCEGTERTEGRSRYRRTNRRTWSSRTSWNAGI